MTLFIVRFITNLLQFILIDLPLQLIGIIILYPICYIQRNQEIPKLPKYLKYFDCADLYVGRDISTYVAVCASGPFNRYCWIAFRNPINYYEYKKGFVVQSSRMLVLKDWPDRISGITIGTHKGNKGGLFRAEAEIDAELRYEYYLVVPYKLPFLGPKCFRFRMGYKMDHPKSNKPGDAVQSVFTINPFASFEGDFE